MRVRFLLLLTLMMSMTYAQTPNAAQVSVRSMAKSDKTELSIVRLDRIKMCLSAQHQVQAVFVFEDHEDMVFDDVQVIHFLTGKDAAEVNDEATALETIPTTTIRVYPNPSADIIHISGMEENSRGAVISISGQRVCEFDGRNTTMDVSGWANGTYLIRVDNQVFKLIKQ